MTSPFLDAASIVGDALLLLLLEPSVIDTLKPRMDGPLVLELVDLRKNVADLSELAK